MITTFSNNTSFLLPEVSFIAGTYKEFTFDIYDESGSPIDSSVFNLRWVLTPANQPDSATFVKSGSFISSASSKNRFTVYLDSEDSVELSGKFIQEPILITDGSMEFRMGKGNVFIQPANGEMTTSDRVSMEAEVVKLKTETSASIAQLMATCGLGISYGSASPTVTIPTATWVGFNCTRVVYDDDGYFTGTSGSFITFPKTGTYIIEVVGGWDNLDSADGYRAIMAKSSGSPPDMLAVQPIPASWIGVGVYMTLIVKRNRGEIMEFSLYQNSGSTIYASGNKIGVTMLADLS